MRWESRAKQWLKTGQNGRRRVTIAVCKNNQRTKDEEDGSRREESRRMLQLWRKYVHFVTSFFVVVCVDVCVCDCGFMMTHLCALHFCSM
jgi:hypothetical protein